MKETNKFLKSKKGLITTLTVLAVLVIGAGIWYYNSQKSLMESQATITENQIMIQRGGDTVIVNDNGLVEYRLASGTYFDTWDLDKVDDFFASLQEKARQLVGQTPPSSSSNYYTVTLYVDGELVTIYVDVDDEQLGEVFDDIPISASVDPFSFGDGGNTGGSGGSATSTPAPTNPSTVSAGGSGTSGGGGNTVQDEFDCDLNAQTVAGKTIISNTLCEVDPPS